LTVHQVQQTAGNVSAFAASFAFSCELNMPTVFGELRWNSSVGYRFAEADGLPWWLGSPMVGTPGAPETVTFTGAGSEPVTFGAATVVGTDSDSYVITRDYCDGVTLDFGETCTVTLKAVPQRAGYVENATLTVPDNTFGQSKEFGLHAYGRTADDPI